MSGDVPTRGGGRDIAAVAAEMTGRWVRGYTAWVGAEAAERRRAEIASDVWEQRTDARERGAAPVTVALSIAGRVVAGVPADLSWVRTQRRALRGQPADRKAFTMTTLGHIVARWWWALGAAVLAVLGIVALLVGGTDLARLQISVIVVLLVAGIVLRHALPRIAGTLVVVGAVVPAALIWAPVLMLIGIPTLLGAAVEVIRLTDGATRRALAIAGLAAAAGGWLWIGGLGGAGATPADPALIGPLALVVGGVALVIATGARRRPVVVA